MSSQVSGTSSLDSQASSWGLGRGAVRDPGPAGHRPTRKAVTIQIAVLMVKINGKSMENKSTIKSCKTRGKSMENQWKINGKSMKNQFKIRGKSVENQWRIKGKLMENQWKIIIIQWI
jgi:hypothetical protein